MPCALQPHSAHNLSCDCVVCAGRHTHLSILCLFLFSSYFCNLFVSPCCCGAQADIVTKHVHLEDLTAPSCRLRRMLHWTPPSTTTKHSPAAATVVADSDEDMEGEDEEDEGSSGSSTGWQLLASFPLMQLHPWVKDLLEEGTKKHVEKSGFKLAAQRANARNDALLLRREVLVQLGYRLGRRPVAAAVPLRLWKAHELGNRRSGRWWHQLPKAHKWVSGSIRLIVAPCGCSLLSALGYLPSALLSCVAAQRSASVCLWGGLCERVVVSALWRESPPAP